MQLIKYKAPPVALLVPSKFKNQFSAGLISAVARSKKGTALKLQECKEGGEEVAGYTVRTNEEKRRVLIGQKIVLIGRAFGAVGEIPSDIMSAIVSFVDSSFGFLSIEEIGIAFSLAASGEIESDVSLYGKPINIDWISRVLRAYCKKRKSAAFAIAEAEERYQKIFEFDEEEERLRRRGSHRAIIDDIIRAFQAFKEGEDFALSVYHFTLLENIEGIKISKPTKRRYFEQAKEDLLRILRKEAEQETERKNRKRTERKAFDILTGADKKNGRQAKIAINSIFADFFRTIKKEPVEALEEDLQRLHHEKGSELTAVRYLVRLTDHKGSERTTKPISREEIKVLIEKIESDVAGIKIERI